MKVYISKEQPFLWARHNDIMGAWVLGLVPSALEEIGEITNIEPPVKRTYYARGTVFATIESRIGVWELRMPFAGRCFTEHVATAEMINADWKEALGYFSADENFRFEEWDEVEL